MKNVKYFILALFTVSMFVSCIDDDNDELTGNAATGGLINVNNPLLSYVVGEGRTYSAAGSIFQGDVQTTGVEVYKSFTNSATGMTSNEELLTTLSVDNTTIGESVLFGLSFTYEDLIEGLVLDGAPLPSDDSQLNIGDFWELKYVATTSEGTKSTTSNKTKVAVGTRYAGVYSVEESAYWNSGALVGNWTGGDAIIESVDATTYRHVGLAFWDDNEYFFSVDPDTNFILVSPEDLEGNGATLNGSPIMTCAGNQFESLVCDETTSKATPDDVNGKDILEFTVGYFRGTGATREFYERMVKKVD